MAVLGTAHTTASSYYVAVVVVVVRVKAKTVGDSSDVCESSEDISREGWDDDEKPLSGLRPVKTSQTPMMVSIAMC